MTVSEKIQDLFRGIEKNANILESVKKTFEGNYSSSFYIPIYRMLVSYKNGSEWDFLANLRQVLQYTHRKLVLPERAIQICKKHSKTYSFIVDVDSCSVDAKTYVMDEDEDLKYSYEFTKRRHYSNSISDSSLLNHFGYDSYISLQQKCMIYLSKQLKEGETFMACLPTGSGKSLTWQAAVARGQFSYLTIVVVPTVALALDHKKNDEVTLKKLPWIESISYSSKEYVDSPEKMAELCRKIQNGKNTILYISPEGLTNYEIMQSLMTAARLKRISAVVVDETHLVIDWGMNFRPEFQFLPALISKLKSLSENTLCALLLSATITEKDKDVLYSLFGMDKIIEFRGDELRPEIEFYSKYCRYESDRNKMVSELIKTVPRPAIVYVGTIAQSENIYADLVNTGYKRIGLFNSEISDVQKDLLLDKWKSNHIDVMVATSAFGMGVDKSDVRTVITAYMPENISRYYQEVGRAGRDGYSALNFIVFCPEADSGVVSHFTDSKVISADNLSKRWIAMLQNNVTDTTNIEANCVWLDTDTAPEHLEFTVTGGRNSGWNEDTISMLARASMISIQDVRRQYKSTHKSFKIKVELKDEFIDVLESQAKLATFISDYRDEEREDITSGKETIKEMLSLKNDACYSEFFTREFIYSKMTCAGCPNCRKNGYMPLHMQGDMSVYLDEEYGKTKSILFKNSISQSVYDDSFGYYSYEGELNKKIITDLVVRLIMANASIIVTNHIDLIDSKALSLVPNDNYMVLTIDEYERIPDELLFGTIVFIASNQENETARIIKYAKECQARSNSNAIIVAPENYYDKEEDRYLSDYTEYGKKISIMLQEDFVC